MFSFQEVKITNSQRLAKRERRKYEGNLICWTPKKYTSKRSTMNTFYRLERKFGYDYEFNQSKSLQYLKEDFQNKTVAYLGNGTWVKDLGRKDKYEKNLLLGCPLKKNPLLKTFTKLEEKLNFYSKIEGFQALKSLKK